MLTPLRTNDFDGYASILRDVTANREMAPGLAK
jgi:hypothetical protein